MMSYPGKTMETRDNKGRWVPGFNPNPSGRPPVSSEERLMRENIKAAFTALGTKSMEEIKEIAEDPKSPAFFAIQAKALYWFYKNGNPAFYNAFVDRTIGPVPKQIDLEVTRRFKDLPNEELLKMLPEAIDALKSDESK